MTARLNVRLDEIYPRRNAEDWLEKIGAAVDKFKTQQATFAELIDTHKDAMQRTFDRVQELLKICAAKCVYLLNQRQAHG